MAELSKGYLPGDVEEDWYRRWLAADCFSADARSAKNAYSIVIPPPNVTGILTLGHVLNNSMQDILARRARMLGKEVLWLPGTDHAGIATQSVVERNLRKTEGVTRRDLGREAFLEKIWEWKEKHGGIIINQLKRLGCSCDWKRERFTMDEDYSRRVQEIFVHLFESGLIYRGKRMVNWCPSSLTALSDEEVIMKPQRSKLYYMRYELVDTPGEYLEIATTRPETLMGDSAVALSPKDKRFKDLAGRSVWRPFPRAELPIIADDHIDPEFGTGVLKVTPAHDKADFEIGQRHGLEIIDIFNPDATLNALAGEDFEGLDRFVAREKAVAKLDELGLLVRVEDYENSVGFSERADVPVEPRISMQWFLRYPKVAEATAAVVEGEIRFVPERWKKTYLHWMENLQDWCISRQLWWGHRIPVWYRAEKAEALRGAESLESATHGDDLYVGTEPPADPENWIQEEDVLDTWFSSWLWPFETMEPATRAKFYPTTDLVTGPDIIFFWVARMIMAGFEFEGRKPFSTVFFTSLIRDSRGRKLSKSLGNSPDPLELIDRYGADGLRFGLMRIAPVGQDIRFDETQIEEGRNFANKLWNACRFRQMQGGASGERELKTASLSIYALDILAKLDALEANIERAYGDYRFNEIAQLLYDFFWSEYCDWFLEAIKNDFREGADPAAKETALAVVDTVLARYLLLLHPYMPHITEELWEKMGYARDGEFLMRTTLPGNPVLAGISAEEVEVASSRVAEIHQAVRQIRNLKAEYALGASRDVGLLFEEGAEWLEDELPTLRLLAGLASIEPPGDDEKKANAPAVITSLGRFYMPLEGLIDVEAERERLGKELKKVIAELSKVEAKLGNSSFVDRAPAEVVEENRERRVKFLERKEQLEEMIGQL
ncbi:MAG: valine--tRNA ligase [Verrucomicrobiales bacterium]